MCVGRGICYKDKTWASWREHGALSETERGIIPSLPRKGGYELPSSTDLLFNYFNKFFNV